MGAVPRLSTRGGDVKFGEKGRTQGIKTSSSTHEKTGGGGKARRARDKSKDLEGGNHGLKPVNYRKKKDESTRKLGLTFFAFEEEGEKATQV